MENKVSRRGFMGAMGMMGALAGAGALGVGTAGAQDSGKGFAMLGEESSAVVGSGGDAQDSAFVPGGGSFAEGALDLGWSGTPADIAALGGSTMPLAELNRRRRAYLDAQTDYTCEDGTVIPAAIVRARCLINTYGYGAGNMLTDTMWSYLLDIMSEEDADFFTSVPLGVAFNAHQAYAATGRPIDECTELLDRFADAGLMCSYHTNDGMMYHHVPLAQGIAEYQVRRVVENPGFQYGIGSNINVGGSGTPFFYSIPCDKTVVSDPAILPYDDIIEIIKGKDRFAVAPCICRYNDCLRQGVEDLPTLEELQTGEFADYMSPLNGCRVETCFHMGDEAAYWIDHGMAREIDKETAIAYMQRSRDDGFILQSAYGKLSETICSCSKQGDCGILKLWSLLGDGEEWVKASAWGQISHYSLEVDLDSCVKCGACAQRCPLEIITMDEESGYPTVGPNCFRCGQCAYVCPQQARKLVKRPDEEILDMPYDFVDDANMKAAWRFEHGLIG